MPWWCWSTGAGWKVDDSKNLARTKEMNHLVDSTALRTMAELFKNEETNPGAATGSHKRSQVRDFASSGSMNWIMSLLLHRLLRSQVLHGRQALELCELRRWITHKIWKLCSFIKKLTRTICSKAVILFRFDALLAEMISLFSGLYSCSNYSEIILPMLKLHHVTSQWIKVSAASTVNFLDK